MENWSVTWADVEKETKKNTLFYLCDKILHDLHNLNVWATCIGAIAINTTHPFSPRTEVWNRMLTEEMLSCSRGRINWWNIFMCFPVFKDQDCIWLDDLLWCLMSYLRNMVTWSLTLSVRFGSLNRITELHEKTNRFLSCLMLMLTLISTRSVRGHSEARVCPAWRDQDSQTDQYGGRARFKIIQSHYEIKC